MTSYPELKGKSVIVTGASRGIGLVIARRFVSEGARVLLTDVEEGQSEQVISFARQNGTTAAYRRSTSHRRPRLMPASLKRSNCSVAWM